MSKEKIPTVEKETPASPTETEKNNGLETGAAKEPSKETEASEVEQDPIEALKEELRKKEEALAEKEADYLRLQADTDNFRKRLMREKEERARFANEKLLKELIPIFENLERALAAPDSNAESLKEGVRMILKQFHALMEKENLQPVESVGKPFDPTIHEALTQVESDEHEEHTVMEEYSKGYVLNGRILRPAKVVVSKRPPKKKAGTKDEGARSKDDSPGDSE